mmetsp:Transcript_74407/g.151097  ORF Transcript_74407/g.151097 Transcript_74407/m.151097 type:complete len:97 (+) Transcript_74407:2038-2328(+)
MISTFVESLYNKYHREHCRPNIHFQQCLFRIIYFRDRCRCNGITPKCDNRCQPNIDFSLDLMFIDKVMTQLGVIKQFTRNSSKLWNFYRQLETINT